MDRRRSLSRPGWMTLDCGLPFFASIAISRAAMEQAGVVSSGWTKWPLDVIYAALQFKRRCVNSLNWNSSKLNRNQARPLFTKSLAILRRNVTTERQMMTHTKTGTTYPPRFRHWLPTTKEALAGSASNVLHKESNEEPSLKGPKLKGLLAQVLKLLSITIVLNLIVNRIRGNGGNFFQGIFFEGLLTKGLLTLPPKPTR